MADVAFEVMSRKCRECLMTQDRIVSAARAAEIIRETKRKDMKFICHLSPGRRNIACRGHHDAMPCRAARFALEFGIPIREIDPETLEAV